MSVQGITSPCSVDCSVYNLLQFYICLPSLFVSETPDLRSFGFWHSASLAMRISEQLGSSAVDMQVYQVLFPHAFLKFGCDCSSFLFLNGFVGLVWFLLFQNHNLRIQGEVDEDGTLDKTDEQPTQCLKLEISDSFLTSIALMLAWDRSAFLQSKYNDRIKYEELTTAQNQHTGAKNYKRVSTEMPLLSLTIGNKKVCMFRIYFLFWPFFFQDQCHNMFF